MRIQRLIVPIYLFLLLFSSSCITMPETNSGVSITDKDGNVYKTVTIGTQVWMSENLRTTHYRNGDPIPGITDVSQWRNLTTGAQCDFSTTYNNYGKLYNGYAVTDSRNIAPVGWHVATMTDWQTLITYLGGETLAGGKIKEVGYTHWSFPNLDASNSSGFTALPSGSLTDVGFATAGYAAAWWSASVYDVNYCWAYSVNFSNARTYSGGFDKYTGFSVRCVKD